MYPAEHYLTALPQKETFGRTAKYINHPNLIPDFSKDLEVTELDKRQADHSGMQNDPNNLIMLLMTATCIQEWHAYWNKVVSTLNVLGIEIKMNIIWVKEVKS